MPNLEVLENVNGVLQGVPVGTGAHDNANLNIFHNVEPGLASAIRSQPWPAASSEACIEFYLTVPSYST
jgi:hypothetical protein